MESLQLYFEHVFSGGLVLVAVWIKLLNVS